jgi:hypothetical protein
VKTEVDIGVNSSKSKKAQDWSEERKGFLASRNVRE